MDLFKQFLKYVSQNIFGMLGVSLYIIADTYFISLAAGANGITVLNLALPIYGVIFAIGQMVGVGSATRYAILKASGNIEADAYFSNGINWLIIISVPFVIMGLFFPGQVISFMGGDSDIVALGIPYERLFLCFSPFFMCNYLINAFVRNDRGPTLAMVGTLSGSIFNIIFDYIFMFVMGMGLQGAALATVMSPLMSMLICAIHFFQKKNSIRFVCRMLSLRRLVEGCKLGISAFVGEISSSVTIAVFNFLILGLVGNTGVAAYGVIANIALMAVAIFNGITLGMQPLLSQYYGLGKKSEIRKILKMGLTSAFIMSVAVIIIIFMETDPIIAIFNSEASRELRNYAFWGMRIYFLGYLFAGLNIILTGYFSAVDRPVEAFVLSLLRGFLAIIFFSVLLSWLMGMTGIWLSFVAAEGLTFLVCVIMIRKKFGFEGERNGTYSSS